MKCLSKHLWFVMSIVFVAISACEGEPESTSDSPEETFFDTETAESWNINAGLHGSNHSFFQQHIIPRCQQWWEFMVSPAYAVACNVYEIFTITSLVNNVTGSFINVRHFDTRLDGVFSCLLVFSRQS